MGAKLHVSGVVKAQGVTVAKQDAGRRSSCIGAGYFERAGVVKQGKASGLAKGLAYQKVAVAAHEIQAFVAANGLQCGNELALKGKFGVLQGIVTSP